QTADRPGRRSRRSIRRDADAARHEASPGQDVRTDRRGAGPAGRHDQEPALAHLQAAADSLDVRTGGRVVNPLTCAEVAEQIDLYAAGECDAAETPRLAAHIAVCPA